MSAKNRALQRTIAERRPKSVAELAAMTACAEQNLLRTLKKLEMAGVVRLDKGGGRALRPVLTARKVYFEIDLLAEIANRAGFCAPPAPQAVNCNLSEGRHPTLRILSR